MELHVVDKRGRIAFSIEILKAAGIKPGGKVTFDIRPDGGIVMKPVQSSRVTRRSIENP